MLSVKGGLIKLKPSIKNDNLKTCKKEYFILVL